VPVFAGALPLHPSVSIAPVAAEWTLARSQWSGDVTVVVDAKEFAEPDQFEVPRVRRKHSRTSPEWVARCGVIGVFSLFATLVSVVYWPGQLDPDTTDELTEAATGHFADWHTPILSALWRIPYLMGITSPGWVLAIGVFTLLVGFYLILRVRFRRATSTAIAILCCAWPPVLSWGVHVGRDAWYAGLSLCAFGFAVRIVRMGARQRGFNLAASLVFAFLAAAAWQVGVVALGVLFVFLALTLLPTETRRRTLVAYATGLLACVILLGLQHGVERAINTRTTQPEQATYVYDLTQMSRMQDKVLFPAETLRHPATALANLRKAQLSDHDGYVGQTSVVEFPTNVVQHPTNPAHVTALRNAWLSSVVHHPWDYLTERTDLALAQLSITHPSFWTYQVPPDGPQFLPVSMSLRNDGITYLSAFVVGGNLYGDPLYTVWVYLIVAAAAVPVLLRRRRAGDSAVVALAISTLILECAVFFTAPALNYRYAYAIVVAGTVLVPVMVPPIRMNRRRALHARR
jgi:hypothetical protein